MLTHKSGKCYLRSPADDFIKYFIRKNTHVSFFYDADELRFEIQKKDEAKRQVTLLILGTLISKGYKTVRARFTVTPKKEDITTSCLEYTFEFNKINKKKNNCNRKTEIVESLLTYIDISDTNNRNRDDNFKYNSIDVGYPAEECFKRYVKAFEEDAYVNLEDKILKSRQITVSLNDNPNLADFGVFESLEVTITITPKKDDNSHSRVKWTIKVEKVDYTQKQSDYFLMTAGSIRENFQLIR